MPLFSARICLALLLLLPAAATAQPERAPKAYLFAHMTAEDYGGLYYAVSEDGLHWRALNGGRSVDPDYLGHPDITVGGDGRYYLVGNPRAGDPGVRIWASDDLVRWTVTSSFTIDMNAFPGVRERSRWYGAPKMFFDPASGRYILTFHLPNRVKDTSGGIDEAYWGSMRTFYVESKDFKRWSAPRRLFPDYDFATIDVIIRQEGNRYYAIMKDEKHPDASHPDGKAIRIASAPSPTGPWSQPSSKVSPNFREAPDLIPNKAGDGWLLYFEQYPGIMYNAATAPRLSGPWHDVYAKTYSLPANARHGAMLPISRAVYDRLVAAFGIAPEETLPPAPG